MRLIVMAHSGEAQAFFKEYKLSEQNQIMPHLFLGSDFYLLICGEGRQLTTERLAFCLGALRNEITDVVNLGIAGSLAPQLEMGKIVSIRTCYQEGIQGKMEFKSFSTNNPDGNYDLVTAHQRVLSSEYASTLSHFAQVADREAWAIGSLCQHFHLNWKCYKLISDKAGEEKEICQRLKELAYESSHALLEFYQHDLAGEIHHIEHHNLEHDLPFELYLTQTQSRQLNTLLEKLTLKYGSLEKLLNQFDYEGIIQSDLRPKEKSKEFIESLKALLSPFNTKINEHIENALAPLKKQGIRCHLDPSLEQKKLQISTTIESNKDIYLLQDALNQFDFNELNEIFEGNFDV